MTLKKYLAIMAAMTAVCWCLFAYVVATIDPELTNWIGFSLFYVSLFLALAGSFAIGGFFIRFKLLKQLIAFRVVKEAFRQSFILAFLVVASLFLLSKELFSWMNLGLLVVGLTVLEFFWLSLSE